MHKIENSVRPNVASQVDAASVVSDAVTFDYHSILSGMEDLLTSLYDGLPRLEAELDGFLSIETILECAADGPCTARVLTAIAQTKSQLTTLQNQLKQVM